MRKTGIFVIAVFFLFTSAFAQQAENANQEIPAKVDEYMNALGKARNVGGAILLARDGSIVVSRGYGLANAELNVPNAANTKFRIGSLTKPFTSAAIMLLQERGKLNVRDAACKYLENCPAPWNEVTIHQLLTHTSGIPNFTSLPDWRAKKVQNLSPVEVVGLIRESPLKFKPGEDYEYNNTGYYLLGLIVEKVSGQTYEAFLKENIFAPLKMNETGYDAGRQILPNRASGYSKNGESVINAAYADRSIPFAAGGLYSTVEDLFRFQQAFDSEQLLKKASTEAIFTPEKRNYGYGWGTGVWQKRKLAAHSGGIEGFSAHIFRFPEERAAVIVLLNNDNILAQTVALDLAAILFGEKYDLPQERKAVALDAKILDEYVGQYEIAPNLVLTVAKDGEKLTLISPGQTRGAEIVPESETQFFLRVVDAQITFEKDEGGKVTGLIFRQMGRATKAKKVK